MADYAPTTSTAQGLPDQHIPSSRKGPKWAQRCVMALKAMSNSTDDMGRTTRANKQQNYDLVNSRFTEEDFEHVLNPYGINMSKFGGVASKMQNYNIIRSKLETLRGEEMNSPLNFFVYAISGEAVSAKKQKRKDMLKQMIRANIVATLQLDQQIEQVEGQMAQAQEKLNTAQDQQQQQQIQEQLNQLQTQRNNLPDVVAEMKAFNSKYVDPTEQVNNKILQYIKRKDKLALKFNLGWFHALVTAEEVYYTGIRRGHPSTRTVNPLEFDYDKGANTIFIHEGNWAREEMWMPISEVISMYGDALTTAQVKKISSGQAGHTVMNQGMQHSFAYNYDGGETRFAKSAPSSHVYVMTGVWRSYARVGMLKFKDPRSGQMEEVEVDDSFQMPKELAEQGAMLTWTWDDEIWEGTLIGDDTFVNIRPRANQTKNLPYVGYVYNNVNSIATSMVDLVKAHQYTYIILWWRLEQELAKAKGKKFIMDFAQLPKSQGWDVDQWLYYFENMGVIWINSMEEGQKGNPSTISNFNQFNSVDMSLSQVVGQYMQVMDKLEYLVEDIMGVSKQRQGDIKASETATGAQTSIARSTNVTRPWFYYHDLVKEAVLNEVLELAKIAYIDGTELELVLDEFEVETLRIDGDKLNGSEMGCFLTNSYEDREKKEKMEGLLTLAVQQGKAQLLDVAKVIDSDSMSYIKSALAEGDKVATERAQADSKAQSDAAANASAEAKKDKELDRAQEKDLARMEIDKDILIKKMDIGAAVQADNGDDMAMAGMLTQSSLEQERLDFEKVKEENRKSEKAKELAIKEKEVKLKSKQNAARPKQ